MGAARCAVAMTLAMGFLTWTIAADTAEPAPARDTPVGSAQPADGSKPATTDTNPSPAEAKPVSTDAKPESGTVSPATTEATPATKPAGSNAAATPSAPASPAPADSAAPAPAAFDPERQFASICGLCHADGGRKSGYGPKLMGTERTDSEIFNRIKNGKPGRMAAFGGRFKDDEIRELIKYIRGLQPR